MDCIFFIYTRSRNRVDFPLPETPQITEKQPDGIRTVMFFRLFWVKPAKVSQCVHAPCAAVSVGSGTSVFHDSKAAVAVSYRSTQDSLSEKRDSHATALLSVPLDGRPAGAKRRHTSPNGEVPQRSILCTAGL